MEDCGTKLTDTGLVSKLTLQYTGRKYRLKKFIDHEKRTIS